MNESGSHQPRTTSRSGATSIYVVVVAALLFTIITVSFIRILLRNASNSAANEMSQMAYDSALAGVEDAKTAVQKYLSCQREGHSATEPGTHECKKIMAAIEASYTYAQNPIDHADQLDEACDSVRKAIDPNTIEKETLIQKVSGTATSATNQAYTCTLLASDLQDYRSTLTESNPLRVIPLQPKPSTSFGGACADESQLYQDDCRNLAASQVNYLRISWYTKENNGGNNLSSIPTNYYSALGGSFSDKPPVLSAQLIQTAATFSLDQFATSQGNRTNRGTVYLNPVSGTPNNANVVSADQLVDTNDHVALDKNNPYSAACTTDFTGKGDFACAQVIALPKPVDSDTRNWETFYLVLNLPYRTPTTDFSVQMYTCLGDAKTGATGSSSCLLEFSGVQVAVDSTGRANDLYSRVEARLEFSDVNFPFPQYALQATDGSDDAIDKNFYITQDCGKSERQADGSLKWVSCEDSGPAD